MATKVKRRVCEVTETDVGYEMVGHEDLVIWRTVEAHLIRFGKHPKLGEVFEFKCYEDYDGNSYAYA